MTKRNVVSGGEFAARNKFAKVAVTAIEKKVVKCYGELEVAELSFMPGQEFVRAIIELHDEIKKNGSRNFMTRLKQLGIPYAKVRYWKAIVAGKPINRGKAKQAAKRGDAAEMQPKPRVDWHEDWTAATTRFREVAHAIIMLEQAQPEGRGREDFIGELTILAESLGYDLKPEKKRQ